LEGRETTSAGKPLEFGKAFYHVNILELACAYTAYTALSGQWDDWAWD